MQSQCLEIYVPEMWESLSRLKWEKVGSSSEAQPVRR